MKKTASVRWFRLITVLATVPIFWFVLGVPVAASVWLGLVLMAACLWLALRMGWGLTTRSISEVIADTDAQTAAVVMRPPSGVWTARRGPSRD
jgi:hypothetical protein